MTPRDWGGTFLTCPGGDLVGKVTPSLHTLKGLFSRPRTRDSDLLMKVGIAGFAGSGKSTVFHWLTGVKPDPAKGQVGQVGMAKVPDERLNWLSAQFKPKKTTPAEWAFLDTPGLLPTE